jgi:hypothetical protein
MSVQRKKAARALRARYGVASGVTQAVGDDAGRMCQVIDEPVIKRFAGGGTFNAIEPCDNPAELISGGSAFCRKHWEQHMHPVRR